MNLILPKDVQAEIALLLASLPAFQGKVKLYLEFDCGTGGHVGGYTHEISYRGYRKVTTI